MQILQYYYSLATGEHWKTKETPQSRIDRQQTQLNFCEQTLKNGYIQPPYKNCPPCENPRALYPFFNLGSDASLSQTCLT